MFDKVKEYQEYKKGEHVWGGTITIDNGEEIKVIKNCFVKNWMSILYVFMANTTFTTNDVNTSSQLITGTSGGNSKVTDNDKSSSAGIMVGTGTTAVDVDDEALGTLISHGATSGKLTFGPTNVTGLLSNSGSVSYNIDTNLYNESGGTITIEEIGLAINQVAGGGGSAEFLVDRTLSTNVMLDESHLQITYQIKQT